VRVFLSAGRSARPFVAPDLIGGFEADVLDGSDHVDLEAAGLDDPDDVVALVGRPNGRRYRNLPWWEVERED
jgi:hypothetical protein